MVKFALFQKWVLDHYKNAKRKLNEKLYMNGTCSEHLRMRPDTIKNLVQSKKIEI